MNWGVGKWGSCLITLSPQNPITPKPYHPKTLSPISCLLNPESRLWIFAGGLSKEPRLFGKLKR
ncbi:hypothetical protein B5D77_06755 [Microcystis sp. MC19]|nr:hypothetical protein B5D77_06755 [Microcystis sp. MC19]